MNKRITIEEAVSKIKDGDTIMVGGFLAVGTPESLIDALVAKGVKDLTLICNDTGFVDRGVGKMVVNKQFKKIIASHIGTNRETGRQMVEGETEVVLVPQGSLVEKIRAGGNGIGGFLVKTGLGTEIQKGKEVINVDGVDYLLKKPLRADVAILFANKADENGNLWYHGTTRNFNTVMATAADWVVVEAEEIVPVGAISPNEVVVPGVFVDNIVQGVK
ncbi:MAG TPA: CoA transferase subunit A [Anaerolineaceae bacterium]|jgi:acetate CoA/acetoacetate CoA-transferase alpha subunit|nr:CoA transferase subunit A [Anaerolineaceae bacterium]HQL92489.1 CoA transferase subunit A [Anaerolineaceae bacterium]